MTKEEMIAKMAWTGVKQRLGGLSGVVDNPLARLAMRYWWLSLPAGFAAYTKYRDRKAKGEATMANLMTDLGMILAPILSVITLAEFSRREESTIVGGQIKDAQFTPIPGTKP
jgi:hypothetical protein